jgi:hypothetical protein
VPQIIGEPDIYADMRIVDVPLAFWRNAEQASLLLFLRAKTDRNLSHLAADYAPKLRFKEWRLDWYESLHPRIIWLYVKFSRNLANFSLDDFTKRIAPLSCYGPEDDLVGRGKYTVRN